MKFASLSFIERKQQQEQQRRQGRVPNVPSVAAVVPVDPVRIPAREPLQPEDDSGDCPISLPHSKAVVQSRKDSLASFKVKISLNKYALSTALCRRENRHNRQTSWKVLMCQMFCFFINTTVTDWVNHSPDILLKSPTVNPMQLCRRKNRQTIWKVLMCEQYQMFAFLLTQQLFD